MIPGDSCSSGGSDSRRVSARNSRVYPGSFTSSDTISDTRAVHWPSASREVTTRSLARLRRREPPERIRHLVWLPDRHELPPARAHRHRHELGRAATPGGNVERPPRLPPVRAQVLNTHAHDSDLPSTGPAGPGRATAAGGIEPDGRGHWITSSARASTAGGIVTPRAFAVLRLITNSNLVGCSMGRSPGLAPLRIRST
jgi:hypothetical protein